MLSSTAVYEAQQLTAILASHSLSATAVPNTPLESVVRANMTAEMAIALPTASVTDFGSHLIEGSKARTDDGAVDHDLAQAEFIELGAGAVAASIDITRNVVNPICRDVLEKLTARVQQQATRDINNIAVVPDFFGEVWNNPQLANIAEPFADAAPQTVNLKGILPDRDDADIVALLETGVTPLDTDVVAEFATTNADLVGAVYREVFVRLSPQARELNEILNPVASNRSAILAVFLLARRLGEDVPEGVAMNLADYRQYMATIMSQAGFALNRLQALRDRAVNTRTLMRGFPYLPPAGEVLVTVNGPVYNEWLKAGGTPEILLGSFITDGELGFDALIARGAEYTTAWNRHLALKAKMVSDDRYSRTVAALNAVMVATIRGLEDTTGGPSKDQMLSCLAEHMAQIHEKDMDDVARLVQRIVCRVMFRHTSSESFLKQVDKVASQYPEMEMEEVTLLATIDHVAEWMKHLVDIKPI